MMDEAEKQKIIDTYNSRFKEYGYDARSLGWGESRSRLRFEALIGEWQHNGASLLDVGCGFGDLYGYCLEQGLDFDYQGIDINQMLIEEGKQQYPGAKLSVHDALCDGMENTFDIVVASGLFNTQLADNGSFVKSAFDFFYKTCNIGFAANFISTNVDYRDDHLNYSDPSEILSLAYSYSRRVSLRNDYMPFEFTVFVYKDDRFDVDNIFRPIS